MPSLLDAIAAKYGTEDRDAEPPIGIHCPRIGPRKSIPRLLILNDCDVDSAGEERNLEKTCAGVLEMDLAHNRLTQWTEICKILEHTPCVSFLNLSFNLLECPLPPESLPPLPRLNTLILIGTKLSWTSVWSLLRKATQLQELHLSLNDFSTVDIDDWRSCEAEPNDCPETDGRRERGGISESDSGHGSSDDEDGLTFPTVRRLMFDGNPVSSWQQVAKLGLVFPSLRHVGLGDCPIEAITEDGCGYFEHLQSLTISNTRIRHLDHISRLNLLPALTELRVQGIPLLHDMTAYERRQLLISLLPRVTKINGGAPISTTEREDAERAFIRKYVTENTEERPSRYFELVGVHGELQPLVDVLLKPTTRVKVRVCCDRTILERHLSVYQTTTDLKVTLIPYHITDLRTMLEPLLGIPSGKMRLFYVDPQLQDIFGREEMRFPSKQLYSYNMRDGDEIHAELKSSNHAL